MSTPTVTPSPIGSNIRTAREAAKVTQLALGHLLGWTGPEAGSHICRFETGQTEPRVATLRRIAEALGVTVESLLKQPEASGAKSDRDLTEYARKLIRKKTSK